MRRIERLRNAVARRAQSKNLYLWLNSPLVNGERKPPTFCGLVSYGRRPKPEDIEAARRDYLERWEREQAARPKEGSQSKPRALGDVETTQAARAAARGLQQPYEKRTTRLARCSGCRGRYEVAAEGSSVCPTCGTGI